MRNNRQDREDEAAITRRALVALKVIETAIHSHPTTGGARRLVKFLAGVYNGQDYPFDLTELRGLDTALANACLDYLNYDRLGIKEVQKHLANGDRDLHRWLEEYGIAASSRSSVSMRGRSPAMISTIARSNSSCWLTGISAST